MPSQSNITRKTSNKLYKYYYDVYCYYNSFSRSFIVNTVGNGGVYSLKTPMPRKHKIKHYYMSSYDLKSKNKALLD